MTAVNRTPDRAARSALDYVPEYCLPFGLVEKADLIRLRDAR